MRTGYIQGNVSWFQWCGEVWQNSDARRDLVSFKRPSWTPPSLPRTPGCVVPEGANLNDEKNLTLATIKIVPGYYRHSRRTAQTFVCKHEKACAGTSMDPDSDDSEDRRLEGDELCRAGFTGNSRRCFQERS